MHTETVTIYTFAELPERAKERAISDWRSRGIPYDWWDESINSLKAFTEHFGVRIKDYSVGGYSYSYVTTDAENRHFRGRKLRDFDPDHMPTGYCADCALWGTFHAEWKKTGDALGAFNEALDAWVRDVVADMEYQDSDEAIAETLEANDYQFTEDGEVWH